MRVPKKPHTAEIVVKKSRFVATAFYCGSFEDLKEAVARTRKANPGARHTVHAAVIGTQFSASDDREPKNTAGRPVLEVLKRSGISNIGVTVVRYFGGILLGKGGLVKAYTDSAKAALEGLPTEEFSVRIRFSLAVPYDLLAQTERLLKENGAEDIAKSFSGFAKLEGAIPETNAQRLRSALADLSGGKLALDLADLPGGKPALDPACPT